MMEALEKLRLSGAQQNSPQPRTFMEEFSSFPPSCLPSFIFGSAHRSRGACHSRRPSERRSRSERPVSSLPNNSLCFMLGLTLKSYRMSPQHGQRLKVHHHPSAAVLQTCISTQAVGIAASVARHTESGAWTSQLSWSMVCSYNINITLHRAQSKEN